MGRQDAPRLDFGGRKPCFFEFRRPSHPFDAFGVQEQQNTVKRGTRSTSEVSCDETKTTKNRSERRFDNAQCQGRVPTAPEIATRASQEPSGRSSETHRAVLEPTAGSQERPRGDFFALRSRSGRLPGRSRIDLGRPKLPQSDFSSIFGRNFVVFSSIRGRFGFDFLCNFVRCSARLSFRFCGFAGPT